MTARKGAREPWPAALAAAACRLLWHLLLLAGAWLALFPLLWTLSSALKTEAQVFAYPPRWLPSPLAWRNLLVAWRAVPMGRYCLNSALVAGAVVAGQLLTSALAAYVLARLHFPGQDLILLGFLATMMIPPEATMVPCFLILRRLGWIDEFQGLIVPALSNPFGIFMLRQAFLAIPAELEDAACLDGCSRLGVLFHVVVPLSRPALSALGVLTFGWQWNAFLWPLIVLNSRNKLTLPIGLAMMRSELGTDWAILMAAAVLASLPTIALYLAAQRHFARGLALARLRM